MAPRTILEGALRGSSKGISADSETRPTRLGTTPPPLPFSRSAAMLNSPRFACISPCLHPWPRNFRDCAFFAFPGAGVVFARRDRAEPGPPGIGGVYQHQPPLYEVKGCASFDAGTPETRVLVQRPGHDNRNPLKRIPDPGINGCFRCLEGDFALPIWKHSSFSH